ncbi:MAG: hypothetical protein FWF08_08750, partial [Oscillospiraceae bacterium]|nr:hypothetical protein [Oscillospiraceae bacterium]
LPKYYGDGWQYIREYIRVMGDELTGRTILGKTYHFERTTGPANKGLLYMTRGERAYVDGLWAKAKELTEDERQLVNVRRDEISYRVWKTDTLKSLFGMFSFDGNNNKQLLRDIWELNVANHGFDHSYVTVEESERLGIYNFTPRYWTWRMLGYATRDRANNFLELLWGWIFW